MDYLPVFMHLKSRPALVVGGGDVAARKCDLLLRAGAQVTVVAPDLGEGLARRAARGEVAHVHAAFAPAHVDGKHIVVAATDDQAVNRAVHGACVSRGIPVNVVDQAQLCTFILPAIVDRSPIVVAISSGGSSPVLARRLRAKVESVLPASVGRLAALAERFRDSVKARLPDVNARRRFWERTLDGPVAELALSGREADAAVALERALQDSGTAAASVGEVYLVGAGPGDPDLLTFRAVRLMQQADVVVYDHLVGDGILDMARRDAHRIYVGKEARNHTLPQEGINELLVRLARQGRRVLRLKGGDPFIFGRGGEEIETLAANGIPFQVVPGVTAAAGAASYAGIPLTHRDHAHACVLVTGHLKDGSLDLDWPALARRDQTVVVYMGLGALAELCRQLIRHGLPDDWPAAVIENATTPAQRVLTGSLRTLPHLAQAAGMKPPALVIVGQVVKLRRHLSWFESQREPEAATEPSE
jgi:uroporphyrin-III C-methyltransferase / precorrin-2 dehydrogenase / sirohydrochlorin ferrochelatase